MKIEALLFDCGGVIVAPATCDWMLPPEAEDILGPDFVPQRHGAFKSAKQACHQLLPDEIHMFTDREEYDQLLVYYAAVFEKMGYPATPDQIDALSRAQAFGDERYAFFDDVLPSFAAWEKRYLLGLVSDAPPSLGRIMTVKGVRAHTRACALSCEVGHIKPHPDMYLTALRQLGVAPQNALYVDDLPEKLAGAQNLGIFCVQMRRQMPQGFDPAPQWPGPVVHSFHDLDTLLTTL